MYRFTFIAWLLVVNIKSNQFSPTFNFGKIRYNSFKINGFTQFTFYFQDRKSWYPFLTDGRSLGGFNLLQNRKWALTRTISTRHGQKQSQCCINTSTFFREHFKTLYSPEMILGKMLLNFWKLSKNIKQPCIFLWNN